MNVSTHPSRRAWVDVDLTALETNARTIQQAAPGARLLPMVKANAYGVGVEPVVRTLERLGPWGFGVATVQEGVELRRLGVERPVVVFTPAIREDLAALAEFDLRPVIDSMGLLYEWAGPYHLEIDTGMGRAGVRWDDPVLAEIPVRPEGVFTHFHSADERPDTVREQVRRLRAALDQLGVSDGDRPLIHAANSAGVFRLLEHFDLVRPGIFLYGGGAVAAAGDGPSLPAPRPVVAVRALVVSIRRAEPGDTVSYGAEWTAPRRTHVATLAIGYADGIMRSVLGRAAVCLGGRRCPVVGRVTMDMTMVDVGPSADVEPGDVATLIGESGGAAITLDEFADWAKTISYEVLVRLGGRLPRLYRRGADPE